MRGLLLGFVLFVGANALAVEYEGSLVIEVQGSSAAAHAGITPGDRITAWHSAGTVDLIQAGRWQPIRSPFDLLLVDHLLASARAVEVRFVRDNQTLETALQPSTLGVAAQPNVADGLKIFGELRTLNGSEKLERIASITNDFTGADNDLAWLQTEIGIAALHSKQFEQGQQWFEKAAATLAASGDSSCEEPALLRLRTGHTLRQAGAYAAADAALEQSMAAVSGCDNTAPLTAAAMSLRGLVAAYAGNFEAAERYAHTALGMQESIAPTSLAVAETRHTLGNSAFWHGDTDLAEQHFVEALRIRTLLAEGSVQHGQSLGLLGNIAWRRGNLSAAEEFFLEAYTIHSTALPNSLLEAGDLTMLGHVAYDRKNFRRAETYYARSLAITEKYFPGDETVANTLMGLGNAARRQYRLEAARDYHTRAMQIYKALDAKQRLALVYGNLANVEFDDGKLDAAEKLYQRSLELRTELGSSESFNAPLHYNIANVLRRRGDSAQARRQLLEVLAVFRSSAPASLRVQMTVFTLGELEFADGNNDNAKNYFLEALEIAERLAPGTLYEAEPLHRLGKLAELARQSTRAQDLYSRAVTAFESQRQLVGGNADSRANFAAQFDYLYKDLVRILIQLDVPEAAFNIVERYRSRILMAMIQGRAQDVQRPVAARVSAEWIDVHHAYDTALNNLMRAKDLSQLRHAEFRAQLDEARNDRDAFVARYRALNPARAAFEYPAAVPLAEALGKLPTSATLLSYLVTEQTVYAFVVNPGEPQALQFFQLDASREELEDAVELFADLLRLRSPNPTLEASQRQVAAQLFTQLVQPVNGLLGTNRTLVILADGVLHNLPFSALVTNGASGDLPRYLIEERAIQYAPSLDWLLATRSSEKTRHDGAVAVFADPFVGDSRAFFRQAQALPFTPLPGAREEARSIAKLFRSTTLFLGESATERNAKIVANPKLRILHFATHGVIDTVRPMESFLLLAGDPADTDQQLANNGLLQAREVAEELTLNNALVVLSACETSTGKLSAGEGVIGLGSAFLYAGAGQVVSTSWAVSDASTSRLMSDFYKQLSVGATPVEALRAVQLAEIAAARGESTGYLASWRRGLQRLLNKTEVPDQHWAAFRLFGEVD